jgi:hexosaminidase
MNNVLPLVPYPVEVQTRPGLCQLDRRTLLQAPSLLKNEADYLAQRIRQATGWPLRLTLAPHPSENAPIIRLLLEPSLLPEGYQLKITSDLVELSAATPAGAFYGLQTILQLLPSAVFSSSAFPVQAWALPCVWINDYPRFSWRGAHLDCARHFRPVEFIRKFIDLLALHKLNVFHWHLTDDQGWRIEIKKYPRLTEVGSRRRGTWQGHNDLPSTEDGVPHGGFYSQEQIREIVRHAASRHVTIVPEIEMPGHADAAIASYPELGCSSGPVEVRTRWGISENIFNPREETIQFLQNVLEEVLDLFPGTFIHIGGDEAVKTQWDESPEIRSLMKRIGVKDSSELQSWFVQRMDRFLTERGRRLVGWDEILEGGLAAGATVMSWRGLAGGIAAAQQGHDVVMTPEAFTYFDHYQSAERNKEPLAIGGFLPLQKVYEYEPVPTELTADQAKHILGLQGQLWAEYMPTTDRVEYMALPRLCALAEVAWSPVPQRSWKSFLERCQLHQKRLELLGVKYRPIHD